MKSFLFKTICISVLVATLFSITVSAVPDMNFVIENGEHIKTPICYSCTQTILGPGTGGKDFIGASDIFIDSNDNIYVADTAYNRIVKLDKNGKYVRDYTNGGKISGPKSVFVADNGDLFVSDTNNQQIVHLDGNDKLIETFHKPESQLLSNIEDFSVEKIAISKQGMIYLVHAQQFMMIDAKNEFKGFVGANKVAINLKEFFIRTFGSEIQKNKMVTSQASTYNSFHIGDNGLIYAVANDNKDQIRILNVDGDNLFPSGSYGEKVEEDKSFWARDPIFVDIVADERGTIFALEKHSCLVYTYTSTGDMVVAFGGIGDIMGKFINPTAVDINSKGEVFVLDSANGAIHKFTPTSYMDSILKAYKLFDDGEYEESMQKWEDVLDINVNCSLANSAMGDILYKQEKYEQAMSYYKNANDKQSYAKAFSKYRHGLFRKYFGWVVIAIVVLVAGIYFLIKYLFKLGKRFIDTYYYGGKK